MAKKSIFDNLSTTDFSHMVNAPIKEAVESALDTPSKDSVKELSIDQIHPFKEHPFRVETVGEDFEQLVESIKENGIINPLLVRPADDGYELISGHRRIEAAKVAGLATVPVTIREMDDYLATIIMVHSNFYRETILPSEKAKAYRMCYDAKKHQGKKGGNTAEEISGENDSKRKVERYIRLSFLSDELLSYVDHGYIAESTGRELSFLDESSQSIVLSRLETMKPEDIRDNTKLLSESDARKLRDKYNELESLSEEAVIAVLLGDEVKMTKPKTSISFKVKEIKEYFPDGTDPDEMLDIIRSLLDRYANGELD